MANSPTVLKLLDMCGRSSLTKNEKELEERFSSSFYTDDLERYNGLPSFNIAPTHTHPILKSQSKYFSLMKWGLIPHWSKDDKLASNMINARIETIEEKVSFKDLVNNQRCLIPFDGYFEWRMVGNSKVPYYIYKTDRSIFSLAGLWSTWRNSANEVVESFTVITQVSKGKLAELHHRMPAILDRNSERLWLNETLSVTQLKKLINPDEGKNMSFHKVSNLVNNVTNNRKELIQVSDSPLPPIQGTLF